jgi:beta-glucanase (GH16 family)
MFVIIFTVILIVIFAVVIGILIWAPKKKHHHSKKSNKKSGGSDKTSPLNPQKFITTRGPSPISVSSYPETYDAPKKINIDPLTPDYAKNKFKGMHLIYSYEMKDPARLDDWLIVDEPLGTMGISDNFSYSPDNVKIGDEGLELSVSTTDEWKSDVKPDGFGKAFNSGKLVGTPGVRFKYGTIEAKIKAPDLKGIWPAFWLNFSNGTFGPGKNGDKDNPEWKSLIDWYPFVSSNFWPPEIDIFELTEDVPTIKQNQSSVHTPNQVNSGYTDPVCQLIKDDDKYNKGEVYLDNCVNWSRGFCPNGVHDSGNTLRVPRGDKFCFGVSQFGDYPEGAGATSWHIYRAEWTPVEVRFYLDDEFYGAITSRDLVQTNSGSMRPVMIPNVPLFPIINLALGADWATGGGNDIMNAYNFTGSITRENFKGLFTKFCVEYIRIYQDDSGSGLNPELTPTDVQQILSLKTMGRESIPYFNVNSDVGGNMDKVDTDNLWNMFYVLNDHLKNKFSDNYALAVDAGTVSNYGGMAMDGYMKALRSRINSILFYMATRYGECFKITKVLDGPDSPKLVYTFTKTPNLKLPDKILNSVFTKNFGNPMQPLSPKSPCGFTQSSWGTILDISCAQN